MATKSCSSQTLEYKRLKGVTEKLNIAVRNCIIPLSQCLFQVNLIGDVEFAILHNTKNDNVERASKLVLFVIDKVGLNPRNYHLFVKILLNNRQMYRDILEDLLPIYREDLSEIVDQDASDMPDLGEELVGSASAKFDMVYFCERFIHVLCQLGMELVDLKVSSAHLHDIVCYLSSVKLPSDLPNSLMVTEDFSSVYQYLSHLKHLYLNPVYLHELIDMICKRRDGESAHTCMQVYTTQLKLFQQQTKLKDIANSKNEVPRSTACNYSKLQIMLKDRWKNKTLKDFILLCHCILNTKLWFLESVRLGSLTVTLFVPKGRLKPDLEDELVDREVLMLKLDGKEEYHRMDGEEVEVEDLLLAVLSMNPTSIAEAFKQKNIISSELMQNLEAQECPNGKAMLLMDAIKQKVKRCPEVFMNFLEIVSERAKKTCELVKRLESISSSPDDIHVFSESTCNDEPEYISSLKNDFKHILEKFQQQITRKPIKAEDFLLHLQHLRIEFKNAYKLDVKEVVTIAIKEQCTCNAIFESMVSHRLFSFLNYHLLLHLVDKFGEEPLKIAVDAYRPAVQKFMVTTTIQRLIGHIPIWNKASQGSFPYPNMSTSFGPPAKIRLCTVKFIDDKRRLYYGTVRLHDCISYLIRCIT